MVPCSCPVPSAMPDPRPASPPRAHPDTASGHPTPSWVEAWTHDTAPDLESVTRELWEALVGPPAQVSTRLATWTRAFGWDRPDAAPRARALQRMLDHPDLTGYLHAAAPPGVVMLFQAGAAIAARGRPTAVRRACPRLSWSPPPRRRTRSPSFSRHPRHHVTFCAT